MLTLRVSQAKKQPNAFFPVRSFVVVVVVSAGSFVLIVEGNKTPAPNEAKFDFVVVV